MSTEAPKFFSIKGKKNKQYKIQICGRPQKLSHRTSVWSLHCVSHVCDRIRSGVCQEHTFAEIVGKAGVIAGAAAAVWLRHRRPDSGDLLRLAQLLDEETLVTALLLDKDAADAGSKTRLKRGLRMLSKPTMTSCSLSWLITLL